MIKACRPIMTHFLSPSICSLQASDFGPARINSFDNNDLILLRRLTATSINIVCVSLLHRLHFFSVKKIAETYINKICSRKL